MERSEILQGILNQYEININPISENLGGGYQATIPQLGSAAFVGDGDTPEEALEDLYDISAVLLEEYESQGIDLPVPRRNLESYSGKFVIRISKSLHRDLTLAAEQDGVSLNFLVSQMLSQRTTEHHIYKQISEMKNEMTLLVSDVCSEIRNVWQIVAIVDNNDGSNTGPDEYQEAA